MRAWGPHRLADSLSVTAAADQDNSLCQLEYYRSGYATVKNRTVPDAGPDSKALKQLPAQGTVRLAIDWTIETPHHLLVVSLITGGRAVPIYWRAYDASVLKGRMRRYEIAVIRRAITRVQRVTGKRRVIVTADRGFADVALVDVLTALGMEFILRVKGTTKVCWHDQWRKLHTVPFVANARRRKLESIVDLVL